MKNKTKKSELTHSTMRPLPDKKKDKNPPSKKQYSEKNNEQKESHARFLQTEKNK